MSIYVVLRIFEGIFDGQAKNWQMPPLAPLLSYTPVIIYMLWVRNAKIKCHMP